MATRTASARVWVFFAAAVALSGCAGLRKETLPVREKPAPGAAPAAESVRTDERDRRVHEDRQPQREAKPAAKDAPSVLERVQAHVAARMPAHSRSVHRRVASAVVTEAERTRIDPSLVLAVIDVESSFRLRARSRAGAKGLMQVRSVAVREELGRTAARRANAFDPATNVRVGTSYLRRLLDAFGDVKTALMAYNAGPSRMRAMLAQRRRIPSRIDRYSREVLREVERVQVALGTDAEHLFEPQSIAAR